MPPDTDVFKTSPGRLKKVTNVLGPNQTSSPRLAEDMEFMTSWRLRIYDVLKTSDLRRLEDIGFTPSWRRPITTSRRCPIYDVLKTLDLHRLKDFRFTTFWRRLIYNILKTSVKRRLWNNLIGTSTQRQKELFFLILYCLKYSEKFMCSA